jgi:hypothetical protein
MALLYDHAGLAAVTLPRIAAEENDGPGTLTARMRTMVQGLVERNGTDGVAELAISLARQPFAVLDALSRATGQPSEYLLDALKVDELDDC